MASRKRRCGHSQGFYRDLNALTSGDLNNRTKKRKTKTLQGFYTVERIISSRERENELQYLVKWKDWPSSSCSWEPANHLGKELIRNFNACTPSPNKERIVVATEKFADAVLSRLKSKCLELKVNVDMEHDIFRFLVKGKGKEVADFPGSLLLGKADFSRFNMHEYWWYFLNRDGEGRTVHFPIRAKPVLKWSAKRYMLVNGCISLAPQKPIEIVSFFIARSQANKDKL